MAKIVPYLWTFLNYNTSSVRKAALQTICSMTLLNSRLKVWNEALIQNTMRHIFQRVLLESISDIRLLAEKVNNDGQIRRTLETTNTDVNYVTGLD